jgi:hypothetical protein
MITSSMSNTGPCTQEAIMPRPVSTTQPRQAPSPQAIPRSTEMCTFGLRLMRRGSATARKVRYIGSGPQAKIWSAQGT